MEARLAFTARFWGDSAVVCRAVEDRPGPVVHQEFGQFDSWTQAQAFAAKLNEGLEIAPVEAVQVATSSTLAASEVLRAPTSPGDPPHALRRAANAVQFRFLLQELSLALTFCRCACATRSHDPNERIVRNARNALFNAVHFVLRVGLGARQLEEITAAIELLKAALQEIPRYCENPLVADCSPIEEARQHGTFLDL